MNYSQEIVGSGTRLPGAHSCFTVSRRGTLSNLELWEMNLISLRLSCFICTMGMVIYFTEVFEDQMSDYEILEAQ